MKDLFRAVNDNCTGGVKAGRLIVGGGKEMIIVRSDKVMDGSCDIHYVSLMASLAPSLV